MGRVNFAAINVDINKKRSKRKFFVDMIKIHTDTDDGCD